MSRTTARTFAIASIAAAVCATALLTPRVSAQQQQTAGVSADAFSHLHWRHIGPDGNRTSAVTGVPGDPLVYYVGAASGGIFKTSDGGNYWEPVFDDQPVASIGSLAVAPSDHNVVWAGTGEGFIRSNISVGQGIYKSTDAGKTWSLMGLEKTGRIIRLVIDPQDANTVLACALGHAYGPQPERGVFRTTDGGKTWTRTLFVNENTGCSDIAIDWKNPRNVFAGMWQVELHTWGRDSGGVGSGLFVSRDRGVTWTRLKGRGLPTRPVGKVAVAIAPSNPKRIYAIFETGNGVPWNGQPTDNGQLWRSDDGGETWRIVNDQGVVNERPAYYSRMAVEPDNENEVWFVTHAFMKTIDGGQTIVTIPRYGNSPGADHHDLWIDPTNGNRMIVGSDLNVGISLNRGERAWNRLRLPIAQMYHVTVDNQIPYNVLGNRQDGPSFRGPSNSRLETLPGGGDPGIPMALWHSVGGGESGWATPDPVDANIIWSTGSGSGHIGGIVTRYDESRRQARNVEIWPDQQNGPPIDVKYRFNWTTPLTISPHDRNKIYVGSQYMHQTTDGGESWQLISPDLTLNDKSRQKGSGGLSPENNGVDYAGVVFSIDESPVEKGLIWAGTNDGLVQVTRDGGKTWTNVTKNVPNLPVWGTVSSIDASKYDAGTAYITVDFHQVNNRDPFIYKTADYGKTWKAIANGIPHSMLSYVHCIREDPVRRGLLYAGTENGIYVSFDDGENWQPLQMNLPHAPVYDIVVQEHFNDLVIATYGRGFWILDDIGPLQRATPEVLASDAYLFPVRPAYRFRPLTRFTEVPDYPPSVVGENPPYGADLNYFVKAAPQGPVTITILDPKGQAVRTLSGRARPGVNRLYWDLRYEPTEDILLRTRPPSGPDVPLGADGTRPAADGGRLSMLAPPNTYTVKLTVGGRNISEPLVVRKDPNSCGTESDIQAQIAMVSELRRIMGDAVQVVNESELIRTQIDALTRVLDDPAMKKAAAELDQKLVELELNFIELRATGRAGEMSKLLSKILYLAGEVGSSDFKPTSQQLEVQKLLEERVKTYLRTFEAIRDRNVAALNDLLRKRNIPHVKTTTP